jgi:type I restriction enzyme, S subunit
VSAAPDQWPAVALKRVASGPQTLFTDGDWIETPYITDAGVRLIQTGNVGVGVYKDQGFRFVSEETFDQLRCTEVLPGDLLVCRLAEPVGRACLVPDMGVRMITSVDNCIVRPDASQWSTRYLNYVLSGAEYLQQLESMSRGGTRDRVSRSMLGDVQIRRPPKDIQERIANFLDAQTGRIDALIAEKERLLKLLAEHRMSVCERVVGDAGPRGRAKLGFHADLLPGFAFASEEFSRDPDDVPLLRGINVSPDGVRWDDAVYWRKDFDSSLERFRLQENDVVFGMDRPWIASGTRVAMVSRQDAGALLLQRVCRLRGGSKLRQRFIYYALASDMFRQSIEVELTGVSVPHISPEQILRFKVPVLTLEEQDGRCAIADVEDQRIQELELHTTKLLERLREYRSSLISSAVTGQIDLTSRVGVQ